MTLKFGLILDRLSDSFRYLFHPSGKTNSIRICSVYYQTFSALLYREAKALMKEGMVVDIICYYTSKDGKNLRLFEGINIFPIQSRSSREKSSLLYGMRLFLFFLKSFVYLSINGLFKKYALIHITTPPDFLVFAAIVPKLLGAKIVMDIHDIGPEFYMRSLGVSKNHPIVRLITFIEKLSTCLADHVITVTDLWRDKLVDRSTSAVKCTTLLNVPDDELFQPLTEDRHDTLNGHFRLYYHGSLEELFGVDTLIESMPLVVQNIPNVKLHIYGGGRLLFDCKALVKKLKIDGNVVFHKNVAFYELPQILLNADIGIVPTKSSVFADEILAMKSLEYLSLGIPIVVSKTKGHSYYYDSSMVRFFEPGDKACLAEAVIDLYKNESERHALKINSRHFIEKHGWQNTKKTYVQIVRNLLC